MKKYEIVQSSIIRSAIKAVQIGQACLRNIEQHAGTSPSSVDDSLYDMEHIQTAPFEISTKALQNTIAYVFQLLHHSCYMLCVDHQSRVLYKLENPETAPVFQQLAKESFNQTRSKRTDVENAYIEGVIQKPFRLMQCIIKPVTEKVTFSEEYKELFEMLELPPGVYLFNLTDAILLRKNLHLPFPYDLPSPVPIQTPMLPIFSCSGQKGFWDIPIPNYDDVQYILNWEGKRADVEEFQTDWNSKRPSAVFRGGPTGCGTTSMTNMRLRLADIGIMHGSYMDVGVVSSQTKSVRFDPSKGISMFQNKGYFPIDKMSMPDQSTYKYIIHVDGNVHAYRLLYTMLTGSLIIRIKSPYTSWVDHLIHPNEHYLMVELPADKISLDSLIKQIDWCRRNDETCQRIAQKGREFAERVLTRKFITEYLQGLMIKFSDPHRNRCLPWKRPVREYLEAPETKKPFVRTKPITKPVVKAVKKTAKKKMVKNKTVKNMDKKTTVTTESVSDESSISTPMSISVSTPFSKSKSKPATETAFYTKQNEKEKCKKGFKTDPKNKSRCIPTEKKNPLVAAALPPAAAAVAVEIPVPSPVPAPVPSPSPIKEAVVEPAFYTKQNEKEKCKKGFKTDPKNKSRCIRSKEK